MTTFSAYTTFWQTVPGIYEYDSFGGISRRRLFVEFTTVTHIVAWTNWLLLSFDFTIRNLPLPRMHHCPVQIYLDAVSCYTLPVIGFVQVEHFLANSCP